MHGFLRLFLEPTSAISAGNRSDSNRSDSNRSIEACDRRWRQKFFSEWPQTSLVTERAALFADFTASVAASIAFSKRSLLASMSLCASLPRCSA